MAIDRLFSSDRIPPQSLEMEQATLGAMIIERTAIEKAAEILRPEDFYRDAHRMIFEAILGLVEKDEPVDVLTVQDQLHSQNQLESIGGTPYLFNLLDSVPTAANAEYYAKIVEEKAILRRLIEASGQIQALAHSEYDNIAEVVDQAERTVFSVSQKRLGAYFVQMGSLVNSVYEQVEYRSEHKEETTGLATPFEDFNYMTAGLQRSDLVIVAARPSMGKTSLVLNMAQHAAFNKKTVALFSLEMSKEQLCLRMLCAEARVDAHRLRVGDLHPQDWKKAGLACARLYEAPIFIDDSPDISALEMRAKCRRLKAEHGLDLVVVDYLQLMRGHKRVDNRTQEIGEISRALKGLARELRVPVVALSQLSRAVEQRENKRPMLSDLRESGSIEADADVVVFIYRQQYYDIIKNKVSKEVGTDSEHDYEGVDEEMEVAELIIAKQRNGPTGLVKVGFHQKYARFDNLARGFKDAA
jgi:replicative DNA helicase